jgi:hypothetical protein
MRVSACPFCVPKAGNTVEEYEDAFWPLLPVEETDTQFSFAVADGATETSYSKVWAMLLVEAYCAGQLEGTSFDESLTGLQAKWKEVVTAQPLPWYAEEKIRAGAFSSLLGFTIRQANSKKRGAGTWEAIAVGDSCLFQIRDSELINSFPMENSAQFNNRPALLSSNASSNEHLTEYTFNKEGEWKAGDLFYLVTDALACWFLKDIEEGGKPWVIKRSTQESFEDWITRLRNEGVIRNDDVTMFRVELLLDDEMT